MTKVQVILIDDDRNVHQAVQVIVRLDSEVALVGQGYDGSELVGLFEQTRPDVVLLDVDMPRVSGPQAAANLLTAYPQARILVISAYRDHESIHQMMSAGARGYVVKDTLARDLLLAIHATASGQTLFSDAVRETLFGSAAPHPHALTDRELEVLRLLAQGLTNPAVAAELKISVSTVRFHTANILDKFSVSTRAEALVIASQRGLV